MEVKTIVIPELRKKAFEVHTSIRNMKRMFAYQLAVAKVSDELDEDVGELRGAPRGLDLLCGDARHPGEQVELVAATPDGLLHLGEHARDDASG